MYRTALLASLLTACGGAHSTPAPSSSSAPAAADDWQWQQWTKLNDARFASEGHQKAWVDVYVPAAFVSAYGDRSQPAPAGMRVAKVQHATGDRDVTGLTVMRKMEAGYDSARGDWYYGVYDPSGTKALKEGRLEMCIDCHDQASDRDYLLGLPTP